MPCFGNGSPICCPVTIAPPARIVLQDFTVAGQAETININQLMTSEVQLEQVTVHWASPLSTSENIVLGKFNTTYPQYSTILIQFDPFVDGIFDWVNVTPFRWRTGDNVYLYYANTDDIGIGAEIILRVV